MSRYTLTRSAERDVGDIWNYIADNNSTAADRMMDRFYERFRLLADNPRIGPVHPQLTGGIRCSVVGLYVILYEFTDDRVLVLRVIHGRRDLPQVFRDEPLDDSETG